MNSSQKRHNYWKPSIYVVFQTLLPILNYIIAPTRNRNTICTVDLDIPNFLAVSLTVALLEIMKFATSTALSSM